MIPSAGSGASRPKSSIPIPMPIPMPTHSGAAMSSSPWGGALGEGDGDVATPVWGLELERGGDVFIAVVRGFRAGRRGRRHTVPCGRRARCGQLDLNPDPEQVPLRRRAGGPDTVRSHEEPGWLPLPHASVSASVSPSESKARWRNGSIPIPSETAREGWWLHHPPRGHFEGEG